MISAVVPAVWALSALAIACLYNFLFIVVFFSFVYMIFWVLAWFWSGLFTGFRSAPTSYRRKPLDLRRHD